MKFAILGVLVVLVISFFVVVWKAAKDWRWYQIVAAIFTMLLAVTLMFPTAMVLKCRAAWHQQKEELETRANRVKAEYKVLKYGDPTDASSEGIVQLTQQLSKYGAEAGRRWRNLRLTNITGTNVTLTDVQPQEEAVPGLPPAEGDAAAAPQEVEPLIANGMVVHGFGEAMHPELQVPLPVTYIGEFHVTTSTPTQVTIVPTTPVTPAQAQMIQNAKSWSLYEMLPLDSRAPFIAEGSVRSEDNYLGRIDEDVVRQTLGQGVSEDTIANYLRDGSRATDDDPPISRWMLVEFEQKHSIEVDGADKSDALQFGFFDGNGRAIDSRLQRGEDASFAVGDQILLKEEAAQELIDDGTVRLIDKFYLRPLNDYRFALRRIPLRLDELRQDEEELAYNKDALEKAEKKTIAMMETQQGIKDKLEDDLAQAQIERQSIEKYTADVAQKVKAMRDAMRDLHAQNQLLEDQLEQQHQTIQRQLDSLTMTP